MPPSSCPFCWLSRKWCIVLLAIIFYKIESISKMLYKSKSNHSLLKGKDISLLHLTTLSNFLEGEQGLAQDITKEIKNQIHLSKKNERLIDKSMEKINGRAEELVRRFEEEKEKNEKLSFLVSHIEGEIYNAKLDKSLELRNKAETDQLEQLTATLKSRERELEKVCEKTNTSSYELSKKEDAIRALRSERTIVSELLDKIERELCNLEHCYKVLVIERTIEEHQCQEKLEDFRKLEQSARREMDRAFSTRKDIRQEREDETRLLVHPPRIEPTASRPSFAATVEPRQPTQGELSKDKERLKEKRAKIENDILKLEREKTVKIVLNNLGISSPQELPESVEALCQENETTLARLSQLDQEIESMQAAICHLSKKKCRNDAKRSVRKQGHQEQRMELKETSEEIRQSRLESSEFKEITKILYRSIVESVGSPPEEEHFYNEEEEVKYYMGFLEAFFEKSYLEPSSRHAPKDGNASKRLTSLLNSHLLERNQMSIYQEQDLLEFAKKNLERLEKSCSRSEK